MCIGGLSGGGYYGTFSYKIQLEKGEGSTGYEPYRKLAGFLPVSPTMTVTPGDPAVTVECTYFPQSAEGVYSKYKRIKTALTNLKEELA